MMWNTKQQFSRFSSVFEIACMCFLVVTLGVHGRNHKNPNFGKCLQCAIFFATFWGRAQALCESLRLDTNIPNGHHTTATSTTMGLRGWDRPSKTRPYSVLRILEHHFDMQNKRKATSIFIKNDNIAAPGGLECNPCTACTWLAAFCLPTMLSVQNLLACKKRKSLYVCDSIDGFTTHAGDSKMPKHMKHTRMKPLHRVDKPDVLLREDWHRTRAGHGTRISANHRNLQHTVQESRLFTCPRGPWV